MIFSQAYWQQFFSGVATATRENFHVPSFLAFLGVYICLTGIIKLVMRPVPSHIQSMKKPRKEAGLYHGETVSFIHATLAVVLVIWCVSLVGLRLNQRIVPEQVIVANNSLTYFLVDAIASQIFCYADCVSRFHHFFAVGGAIIPYVSLYGGGEVIACIFLAEISNPCLQMRNTLRRRGQEGSCFYTFLERTFVFIFLLFRLFLAIPFCWLVYSNTRAPLLICLLLTGVLFLSMIWNIEIINKLWKAVEQSKTHGGKLPLSRPMQSIKSCVKALAKDKVCRLFVWFYCGVFYFVLPFGFFRFKTLFE